MPLGGCWMPILRQHLREQLAILGGSIDSTLVPTSGAPASSSPRARLSGVWPPNCTMIPFGVTRSTTFITSSCVSGSKNSMSEVSKSVDTVSGLLLTITVA